MKLSELKTTNLIKLLLYGQPGAGKTVFASSFPGPILVFDFDNKMSSAARFFASDKERMNQIEVISLGAALKTDPIDLMTKHVDQLVKEQQSGTYTYRTLVVDSITTFSAACLLHIVRTNPGIKRVETQQGFQPGMQDYGILKREFTRLIPGLLSLDMNVVMLGHESLDKDEITGELIRGVTMDGSFSQQLPVYFEEVWRAFVKEDKGVRSYWAQTQSDGKYKCRSQIPGLPAQIPLSYPELIKQR
jgi:phage nucleotide-binding protein